MRRVLILFGAAAVAAACESPPAVAQSPLTLNLRGGGTIPVGSFRSGPDTGGDVDGGFGLGLGFGLRRGDRIVLEGGFGQHRFDCADDGCPGGTYVSTSWDLGALGLLVLGRVSPFLRAGATLVHLEREFAGGDGAEKAVSELGVGVEVGAGVDVRLARRYSLRSAVRYTRVDVDFEGRNRHRLRYLVTELGLVVAF